MAAPRWCWLLVVAAIVLIDAASASADTDTRWVTFAARVCDTYEQVTANRARNNIQESLKDLGANTPYGTVRANGTPIPNEVDPNIEDEFQPPPPEPGCRPLAGWKFKLGTGYRTKADVGVWGSLSSVTDPPYSTDITTSNSTQLYNRFHVPVGNTQLAGATTIELTEEQRKQANSGQSLWLQGGVPGTPITGDPNLYGFAALRCATDNLNGDNVEFITYPVGGVNHVFCYAYYVNPAPKPGKIIVTKQLAPDNLPASFPKQTFRFTGNISYEVDNNNVHFFELKAGPNSPASMTFDRAAGTRWTFKEQPVSGFLPSTPTCTSTPAAGGVASGITMSGFEVAVDLAAGDTVRCTFVNTVERPPVGRLDLRKVTLGNVGQFGFAGDEVDGPLTFSRTIKTLSENVAYPAQPVESLVPGIYEVTETLPTSNAGTWSLQSVFCGGASTEDITGGNSIRVRVPNTAGKTCTFTNRFKHAGAISISKETLNGIGTMRFQIRPTADPQVEYEQFATTTEPGERVEAKGDRTDAIPLGLYAIQETTASVVGDDGFWRVVRVDCDGPEASEAGRVVVRLTTENPKVHCHFVNQLVRIDPPDPGPLPPEPTPPSPPAEVPSGGVLPESASNLAELRVTKSGEPRRIAFGERARYRIVVRNRGPATARSVVLAEHGRAARATVVRARTSKGSCRAGPPRYCSLGNLRPGQRAVVSVVVTPERLGRLPNIVAVHTGTPQRTRRGKIARATVVVVPQQLPRFTG